MHGSTLLRLIGLTVPFYAVVAIYSTLVWIDQRVWTLAALQLVSGALMVGVTLDPDPQRRAVSSRMGLPGHRGPLGSMCGASGRGKGASRAAIKGRMSRSRPL